MDAHPTGNMVTVGKHILWSYISPVDDPSHKACVMISTNGENPSVLIKSDYSASDFMLSVDGNEIYCIERRYLEAANVFEARILKMTVGTDPVVIWDWFKDDWSVGAGGFFMITDDFLVFGRYPGVYSLTKDGEPEAYFDFNHPIKRIRETKGHCILLLGDDTCFLVEEDGGILKQWEGLIDEDVEGHPLDRNQIFDADYHDGELLLAYWGKRVFFTVDDLDIRKTLVAQKKPLAPHWVAFWGRQKLLFSSKLFFDGSPPEPCLILFCNEHDSKEIWKT